MATRYDTCPTCSTQTGVSVCDNCKNDIPTGQVPAVSGRVWDPNLGGGLGGFASIDLCSTCTAQEVNLLAIVATPEPEQPIDPDQPTEPGEPSQPEPPAPTDAGATPDA